MTNGGNGLSHQEHQAEKVGCNICGKVVRRARLAKHQQTAICKKASVNKEMTSLEEGIGSITAENDPRCYNISLPKETVTSYRVVDCPYKKATGEPCDAISGTDTAVTQLSFKKRGPEHQAIARDMPGNNSDHEPVGHARGKIQCQWNCNQQRETIQIPGKKFSR
jgi:hypothetical protein